ncbi:MAG: hypothetical protein C0600_00950 [Ignavibacteria bacterium]|nr:MAG: hypothetical protein C0600_00950 [Ignavibacteria bacterium]
MAGIRSDFLPHRFGSILFSIRIAMTRHLLPYSLCLMQRTQPYRDWSAMFSRIAGPLVLFALLTGLVSAQQHTGGTDTRTATPAVAMDPPVIDELHFEGNTVLEEEELLRLVDSRPGAPFSEQVLTRDIERILTAYDRSGYPFAEVRVEDLVPSAEAEPPTLTIRLGISEGLPFRIMEVMVEGNTLTHTDVILRETRIEKGELYDAEKVNDIRRRLERLEYFSRVDNPQLYMRDSSGGLLLRVAEGNTNRFDGVIGYQPAQNSDEDGYLTGLVDVSFRNLFGTGRQLAAHWERATRDISQLELHYLEPWVLSLPLNIGIGFFQRQQDSAYVRRSIDAQLRLMAGSSVEVGALLRSTTVIPSVGNTLSGLTRSSTLEAGIDLRIDTRDDLYHPLSGIMLRNAYSGGSKRFERSTGEEVSDFIQRIEVDAAWYQELLPRTILALALHGRELNGDELDISDLYRLGGARSLRGYREEQFVGTRFAWLNTELRYSLGRRTFAFVFFDFGYIYQSPDYTRDREELTAWRNGYGLGGQIETGLGIMGVSYALGQGDGFSDGKIHFGLVNAF